MTTAEKIQILVDRYAKVPLEANYLHELMEIRRELSCIAFDFGHETGKYKRDYDKSYANRKNKHYFIKREKMDNFGIGKAETIAEVETADLRTEEKTNEGMYTGCKIILMQANIVMQSITQDISHIKGEYQKELNN